jgi:hypothetical protein
VISAATMSAYAQPVAKPMKPASSVLSGEEKPERDPDRTKPSVAEASSNITYRFGDRFTTRHHARDLLEEEGQTYVAHFACKVSDCGEPRAHGTAVPTVPKGGAILDTAAEQSARGKGALASAGVERLGGEAQSTSSRQRRTLMESASRSDSTPGVLFSITGFHPAKGARTWVLSDLPCSAKASWPPAGLSAGFRVKESYCFAGYTVLFRVEHDFAYSSNSSTRAWAAEFRDALYYPAPPPGEVRKRGKWALVATIESGGGRTAQEGGSGSFDTYSFARVTDSDGKLLFSEEERAMTIPGSAGPPALVPSLPGGGTRDDGLPRGRKDTLPVFSSEMSLTEKSELCRREADAKKSVARAPTLMDRAEAILGQAMLSFEGSLGIPGTYLKVKLPDNSGDVFDALDEREAEGMAGAAYLDCMEREAPEVEIETPATGVHLLTFEGSEEESYEITTFDYQGSGGSCESWSTSETETIDGLTCTITTSVECDQNCDCTRTEVEICDPF